MSLHLRRTLDLLLQCVAGGGGPHPAQLLSKPVPLRPFFSLNNQVFFLSHVGEAKGDPGLAYKHFFFLIQSSNRL